MGPRVSASLLSLSVTGAQTRLPAFLPLCGGDGAEYARAAELGRRYEAEAHAIRVDANDAILRTTWRCIQSGHRLVADLQSSIGRTLETIHTSQELIAESDIVIARAWAGSSSVAAGAGWRSALGGDSKLIS